MRRRLRHGMYTVNSSLYIYASNVRRLCRQYLVVDPATSEAVIIDTVLDYDHASGTISTETADGILSFIEEKGIKVRRIL